MTLSAARAANSTTIAMYVLKQDHPTPPLGSLASTLPLRGMAIAYDTHAVSVTK